MSDDRPACRPALRLWVAAIVVASTLMPGMAPAATSTIGQTWPIAEPDALTEIEGAVARQPANIASRFGPRDRWSAMKAATLMPATTDRIRTVVPFYTLDMDVTLPDGRVLYPRGFTFNPLTYVSLPQRLVIVAPSDLGWALRQAGPTDWILLAADGRGRADPLAMSEKVGRPIFLLEQRVKDRLGLTVAPVIVRQTGQKLELREVRPDHDAAARGRT